MESLTTADPRVSEAIVIWTGYGAAVSPVRDEAVVQDRFGELAVDLMPLVRRLEAEFYQSDARHVAVDVTDMGQRAEASFSADHPELSAQAVKALGWCYTFDYK